MKLKGDRCRLLMILLTRGRPYSRQREKGGEGRNVDYKVLEAVGITNSFFDKRKVENWWNY